MGLIREMVIAGVAGADTAVDAYRVAFVVPEILNHILASGFLSVTFIPIFSGYLAEKRDDEGWHVFSLILTVFGAFLLVLVLVAEIFAPSLIGLLAPGRTDPVFLAMAVRMTRIILPAQVFFFAGGLLMAVQFAREQFFIPALAPLVYNLGIILGGVLLAAFCGMEGFAWGVLGGSLVGNFAIQIWGARRIGMRFAPVWQWRHPDLWRYLRLTLPLMHRRAASTRCSLTTIRCYPMTSTKLSRRHRRRDSRSRRLRRPSRKNQKRRNSISTSASPTSGPIFSMSSRASPTTLRKQSG